MPISIGLPLGSGGKAVPPDAKIRPSAPDILWAAGVPTISKIITVPAAGAMAFSVTAPTISGAGASMLLRDQFTTAINPLVDGAAEPGPGKRVVTGSLWKIIGWLGNLVFFSTLETNTYAARVADGKIVWKLGLGKYSPGIATERHYYFSLNGMLVAYRGRNSPPEPVTADGDDGAKAGKRARPAPKRSKP